MSYRIEYQYASFRVPLPDGTVRHVIAVEGGDNNLCDSVTNKRSRSWEVCFIGTAFQVLKQAVYFAGACEGGCLKPLGRDAKPEAYISRIRRLIEGAEISMQGRWYPSVQVPSAHPLVEHARALDLASTTDMQFGREVTHISIPPDQHHLVFTFKDQFPDLHAWNLAKVSGLPSS